MVSNAFTAKSSYDVFLSYNSADHGLVEQIARKLRGEGLEPFLDRWYLAPGARWRSELEKTLGLCKAVAIFVGPGEMGSWQQREADVALDLQSRSPHFPVIPVLLPGCEPPLGFLCQLTWVDLRTQTFDLGIAILAKAARGEAPGPDLQEQLDAVRVSICPYRGLLHFREEDAAFFFGREAALDKLMDAVQRQSFVAVVGASGSGKSSVVRAGLVPRLRSDRRTAWETVILVPTDHPLKALARALVPLLEPTMGEVDRLAEATKLAEHFRSGTISLYDTVERILEKQPGTDRVLIVVDQFEELYTLTSDDETRGRFLDELLVASSRAGSKANIALTLRGDFVGKALGYRPLSDRLQDAQINLGPMTREELGCAMRKPAENIQLEFESGLVRRILNDVGDEPGNLPLLEFVLKELWEKRRGRVLLNETYDAIGGLQGAVATKADEFLKGLSPVDQKILQRVFLRIVRPAEGGLDTRRRAAFTELPCEAIDLVTKLANERLLVTNQSAGGLEQTVEVAHEALISNWSTLRAWVNEDREFLLWRDRLGTLLTEWERAQESDGGLLRGPLLIEAQRWFDERSQDLSDQERKFIPASQELRERLARVEAERQERELENAQKLARAQRERAEEAEKRVQEQKEAASKLRLRALVAGGAAVAALILLALAAFEMRREKIAANNANNARAHADELINFMLFDLFRNLEPIGRLDLLNDVTEEVNNYLDNLPNEAITDPRQRFRWVILNNLGNVLVAQGKLQEALDSYQKGLTIAKRLADQEKSDAGCQRDLTVSYDLVGDVLRRQNKLPEALDCYQKGLKIRQEKVDKDPSNLGWQRDLSVSFDRVGNILVEHGKLPEALSAYQQSLAITKRLVDQDQSNTYWQRELSVSYDLVGDVLRAQGKLPEAWDLYQEGLKIRKKLADQEPSNNPWQRELSLSYERLGDFLRAQSKLPEALDYYQRRFKIAKSLLILEPSNTDWQRDLSVSYERIAQVLSAQHKLPEALNAYQQDLEIAKSLVDQDPSNAGWKWDLSVSYARVGDVLTAQGKLPKALDAYQQRLEIAKPLVDRDPSKTDWMRDLWVSFNKVGDVLRVQGKLSEALLRYQEGLNILRTMADRDNSNSDWQLDLALSYDLVGDVERAQGKLPEARGIYQQSLNIRRILADRDKSNPDWQRNLIVSFYKLGIVTVDIRDTDNLDQANTLLRTGLDLAGSYKGADRQNFINAFDEAIEHLKSLSQ